MSVLQYATSAVFLVIFLVTFVRAVRQPLRGNLDIAALFACPAIVVGIGLAGAAGLIRPGPLSNAVIAALLLAVPYLLLRLLDDFAPVAAPLRLTAGAGLLLLAVGAFVWPPPRPALYNLVAVLYFAGLQLAVTAGGWRAARRSSGITRRRLLAAAAGSLLLAATIVFGALVSAFPDLAGALAGLGQVCGLGTGIAYCLAFATPPPLRRLWQDPELRAMVAQSPRLIRHPEPDVAVRELERAAAAALGAQEATLGLWDPAAHLLRFRLRAPRTEGLTPQQQRLFAEPGMLLLPAGEMLPGRVFASQQSAYAPDLQRDDPAYAAVYRALGAGAALVAPATAGDRRLGVLCVFATRPPVFAADDLQLVRLLADQAAVVLESRLLVEEMLRLRARTEASRLKEDFLSAAAHDLKTPVTALVAQAHLLERRAARDPATPTDPVGLQRLLGAARRLDAQIAELLEAARSDRALLPVEQEPVDLAALAADACAARETEHHRFLLLRGAPGADAPEGPLVGRYDRVRLREVLDHLLDNAAKYSPAGGQITVRVWREGDVVRLSVADPGVGIPPEDLPYLFERFHRGTNVDDRRFAGMGLGLYLARLIVEQHGGRIWATSAGHDRGSTFQVALPAGGPPDAPPAPPA